jgi:hypothetical protein
MLRLILAILILTSGCVSARDKFVVFPMQQQDPDRVAADRLECEAFAKLNKNNRELAQNAAFGAAFGAGAGALNGAIQGAYLGRAGQYTAIGAGVGAGMGLAAGAIAGAVADHQRYLRIYATCMSLRGYTVTGSIEEFGFPPVRS